jgi:hypothetical protein
MFLRSIAFAFFVCFSLAACAADNDFDIVCNIFKELQNKPDLDKLSNQQRVAFITQRINKSLDTSSAARISWEAVVSAVPEQRYKIFKSGAEEVLNQSWACEPMSDLASTTGE